MVSLAADARSSVQGVGEGRQDDAGHDQSRRSPASFYWIEGYAPRRVGSKTSQKSSANSELCKTMGHQTAHH
jgi:hypothetical protein